jgi:inhibitor of KinA
MKIIPASDSSLMAVFGNEISPGLHARVMTLFRALQRDHDVRIRNLHPGYASLLVDFDPLLLTHEELAARIHELADQGQRHESPSANAVTIPVCYDPEFAPDLAEVAAHNGISTDDVVRLHSSATYLVYFLGFSPGFAYLGGLPRAIHTPRLATPRKHVVAGSVGIAGSQTGVYPIASAGGWRLIGRTPLRMFDPVSPIPTRLRPGDLVRFELIDRATFEQMRGDGQ